MPWSIVVGVCTSAEELLEGLPELRAEDGVDDRVKRGVEVAEPQEEAQDFLVDTLHAQGCYQSCYEERKPTQDKSPGDNSQRLCGLFLPFRLQRHVFLLLFLFHLLLLSEEESHVLCLAGHIGHVSFLLIYCTVNKEIKLFLGLLFRFFFEGSS